MLNVPLSNQTKEIIFGSLLGDGSLKIHQGYKNARFSFRHSEKQRDYFFWKVSLLKEISSSHCVFRQVNDGGYSKVNKLRYQSLALKSLSEIYNLTHRKGKFIIRRHWLNKMSPLSLAIWWFDDGAIISNGRKGVICTDSFDKKEVKTLAQYLCVVWRIKTKIGQVQGKYWRLWLHSTEEIKKFLRIILPHVKIPSLLSKVILLYKDNQLQQRWISEVAHLTGFSVDLIEKYLAIKKARYKSFRE